MSCGMSSLRTCNTYVQKYTNDFIETSSLPEMFPVCCTSIIVIYIPAFSSYSTLLSSYDDCIALLLICVDAKLRQQEN